jgi:fibronectin-binding autotransporter adhesin
MTQPEKPPVSKNGGLKLWSKTVATTLFAILPLSTALADGGAGGPGAGGGTAGAPGVDNATSPGGAGGAGGGADGGGGGGGAGLTGGAGGAGSGDGGSGGAGGAHGHVGTTFAGAPMNGADGGQGQDGTSQGGGGGGGAGGYGAVITGTGNDPDPQLILTRVVTGGAGGRGGAGSVGAFSFGGGGGDGGIGILFTASGTTATINANVTGGVFGDGGPGISDPLLPPFDGPPGFSGAGIVGSGLSLTLGATVSGGAIPGGATADALRFLGGVNTLRLNSGWGLNGGIFVDGILDFDQISDVTIEAQNTIFGFNNREIWGTGLLRFTSSAGTVTLNGENGYSGGTEINGGLLAIGHMDALGTDEVLFSGSGSTPSSTLTTNISGIFENNVTFDSNRAVLRAATGTTLTLAGALTQTAGSTTYFGSSTHAGTIEINGAVSGTGATIVDGGTLNLNGSVGGNLTVNSGAKLTGDSTIGGNLTLNSGGTLASGNSIGTTTVNGNYVGGGTLAVEVQFDNAGAPVNGVTHDFLNILGNVSGPATTVSLINFAPSTTPAATTGNGIEIIRVGGTTQANAFTMTQYLLGNYNYNLAYLQDYNGTTDGFFLRSTLATPGCVVTTGDDACFIDSTTNQTVAINALAGNDTLQLSGAMNFNFDISRFGSTYTNFELLQKAGTSTVTLTETTGLSSLGIDVQDGRLIAGTDQLGANGVVNIFAPGTFEVASALTVGSIAGAGSIDLGANLTIGGTTVDTFSGVISGSGGLVRQGTGTTILSGANTYSGGTTLNGGLLVISSDANLGAATGGLTFNGGSLQTSGNVTLADTRAVTLNAGGGTLFSVGGLTIGSVISGVGRLTHDQGLTVLTGANTYTGGTGIAFGTLQIGNGGTTGSLGTGAVTFLTSTGSATLAFNRSDTITVANVISGNGSLTQAGTGTTILTGANTYSGATTISGGTLQLGNGGSSGSLGTGAVTNNGALSINRSDAVTLGNAISGTGSLTQAGTGTTTLTGANTYSGATTISAGTLQVGNGGSSGSLGTGAVTNNGTLVINRNGVIQIANAISGTGGLTIAGNGITELHGANTYSGVTTIANGTLFVGNFGTRGTLGTGAVTNNATLVFARSDAVTVANVISGTGRVEIAGGNVTLSGANSYSGATLVGGRGVLSVDADNNLGDATAELIFRNGTLRFNSAFNLDAARAIILSVGGGAIDTNGFDTSIQQAITAEAGTSGGLVKAGAGTLTLTGANTYSGATTISGGTLQLGNGGSSGSLGTGAVTNNGALSINRSDAVTLGNAISGTGSLTQAGTGTTTLTGANTYSGATTISGGTLQVGNGGTSGSLGTGAVTNNGALAINRSDAVTLGNVISGTGSLTQAGTGTTTLTGANIYSGATTISAGTLQVGNGGTTGSLGTGAVTNNGTLAINRFDILTVANVISGAGSLIQAGPGFTTLTGANTYSGTTTISAGLLQVGAAGTSGTLGTGAVINNGQLFFNRSDAVTVGNAISGTGSLTLSGTGTTTLTGANTYTGPTRVSRGTLSVNGSIASSVSVDPRATLAGTGTITGDVRNLGTLTPGNGIGTLNIVGNYTQGSDGVLDIEYLNRGGSIDRVNVTGSAALDGTVRFRTLDNTDATGGTFLTATGGVTGTFSSVDLVGRLSPVTISYGANSASVAVLTANANAQNAGSNITSQTSSNFRDTGDQNSFARPLRAQLLLTLDFAPSLWLRAADSQTEDASDRSVWISAFGGSGENDAYAGALGFESSNQGVAIGGTTSTRINGLRVGGSIGWSDGEYTLDQQTGSGEQEALMGSVHVNWDHGPIGLQASLFGGDFNTETRRIVSFNGALAAITGETSSNLVGVSLSGARRLGSIAGWNFAGTYTLEYTRQAIDASTESGTNPLRLTTPARELFSLRNEASLLAGRRFVLPNDQSLEAVFGVGVGNLNHLGSQQFTVTFASSGARLGVQGDNRDEAQANANGQLAWRFKENMALNFGAAAEFGDNTSRQASVGFEMRF